MRTKLLAPLLFALAVSAQTPVGRNPVTTSGSEPQDAERTKSEISQLLERYPPALREALGADGTLLSNQAYLLPYPALASFVKEHPEVTRDPNFYLERFRRRPNMHQPTQI